MPPQPEPIVCEGATSRLEDLPFDIIEKIFLESMSVNLPRAAPRIGVALSNSHTINEFCKRAFCMPIRSAPCEPPAAYSPTRRALEKAKARRRRAAREMELMSDSRSMALESRWASLDFFIKFQADLAKSKDLWFGTINAQIPAKVIKWPQTGIERSLFMALASAGASIDPLSINAERVAEMWIGAMSSADIPMMRCLIKRRLGRIPGREERAHALKNLQYNVYAVRDIQQLRQKVKYIKEDATSTLCQPIKYPDDWPLNWPEDDPEVFAGILDAHNTSREAVLRYLAIPGDYYTEDMWQIKFQHLPEEDSVDMDKPVGDPCHALKKRKLFAP